MRALLALVLCAQIGCASKQTKTIALGMLGGAAVGAVVGHEFVHHGEFNQYQSQNTIVTSVIFALVTGGILFWHQQAMQDQMVEISARYSRYRLCNPDEMQPELARKLGIGQEEGVQVQTNQLGKLAIALDDNTKWSYPIFRKRYLPPERGDSQVLSSRYIWEIMKPGSFVTRSQDPGYFLEEAK